MDAEMKRMQAAEPPQPGPGEQMPPAMAPGMTGPMGPMGAPGPEQAAEMPPEIGGPNVSQQNIRDLLLATKAQASPRPVA
jgi:hypothetical protein